MATFLPLAIVLSLGVASNALVPDGVDVQSCDWVDGRLRVRWAAPSGAPSDYFEVQLSSNASGQAFSIFSTASAQADIDSLLPNAVYWVRIRAHVKGTASLGPGNWGGVGSAKECRTGATLTSTRAGKIEVPTGAKVQTLEVMRESEFTYEVDYLMNHNSGDVSGDVAFLTMTQGDPSQKGFLNVTLRNATFSIFCVDMLAVQVPDTFTTGGNSSFADYLSCNDNKNASDPLCICDNEIDRVLGGLDINKGCSRANGSACGMHNFGDDCICNCTKSSLQYSNKYTGMMPFIGRPGQSLTDGSGQSLANLGRWYSHPKATECREDEEVGSQRADGTECTWKRRPAARVIRGWEVLDAGWNITSLGHMAMDPAMVRQNTEVVYKVLMNQSMQQWQCDSGLSESRSAIIV
jgi:hypothetical protein